jgi:hypothetical protein
MDEAWLRKVALGGSVIGIIVLFFVSSSFNPTATTPELAHELDEGEDITLDGIARNIEDNGKILRFEVVAPCAMDIMLFKSANITLEENDFVSVAGQLSRYHEKDEVVASEIEVWD